MKRTISKILMIITIFCMCMGTGLLIACTGNGSTCKHTDVTKTVITEATCTTEGSVEYKCNKCGAKWTEATDALGHDFGKWFYDVENKGHHKRVCKRDNTHVETEECTYLDNSDVCTICKNDPTPDTGETEEKLPIERDFYKQFAKSFVSNSYTLNVTDFIFAEKDYDVNGKEKFSNEIKLSNGEITLSFDENGELILYWDIEGKNLYGTDGNRHTYDFDLNCSVENNIMYDVSSMGGENYKGIIPIDHCVEIPGYENSDINGGLQSIINNIKTIYQKISVISKDKVFDVVDKIVSKVLVKQKSGDNYKVSINEDLLKEILANMQTKTVAQFIDLYFGEGAYNKTETFVNKLVNMKAIDAINEVIKFCNENGVETDYIYALANSVFKFIGGDNWTGVGVDVLLKNEYLNNTIAQIMADIFDVPSPDNIVFQISRMFELLKQDLDPYGNPNTVMMYVKMILGVSPDNDFFEINDIEKILDSITLDFITDERGKVLSSCFDFNNTKLLSNDYIGEELYRQNNFVLNLKLDVDFVKEITTTDKRQKITNDVISVNQRFSDFIIGKIKSSADGKYVVKKPTESNQGDYCLPDGETYTFTLNNENKIVVECVKVAAYENTYVSTTDYKMFDYNENVFRSCEILDNLKVIYKKCCVDSLCASFMFTNADLQRTEYDLKFNFVTNELVNNSEPVVTNSTKYGDFERELCINTLTGKFNPEYGHDFVLDKNKGVSIESVNCGERYKDVYVCTKCGQTKEIFGVKNHKTDIDSIEYRLEDGVYNCLGGLIREYRCVYCNQIARTQYVHEHYVFKNKLENQYIRDVILYCCLCGEHCRIEIDGRYASPIKTETSNDTTIDYYRPYYNGVQEYNGYYLMVTTVKTKIAGENVNKLHKTYGICNSEFVTVEQNLFEHDIYGGI